jgi:hypothetical protein
MMGLEIGAMVSQLSLLMLYCRNYEVAASSVLKVCSLTINNGFALTVKDKGFVVIQNDLNVNTGAKLEIENQGSLVMISDTGL